jgi:predicted  nucleic acid-binding Zn-ribbon protein
LPAARQRIYNPSVSRAFTLFRLQQTDLSIDQVEAKLAAVEAALSEHSRLERARQEAARTGALSWEVAATMRTADDALTAERDKLGQIDGRLYGGSVHNPKELQELQSESEAVRRHLASLEDRLLEVMQVAEDAEAEAARAQAELELAEAESSGREANLRKERETLVVLLQKHQEEREAVAASVSPAELQLYLSLRKGPGSLAVAELQGDTCGACGVTMSASARQEIRSGPGLTRCRQCGRILYAS